MAEQLQVLALPFVACLILTGIHAYLGIHVLSRKVIFVDIALAQIAALGATVAFLLGYNPRSEQAYWFSLSFAVMAAIIFALTRSRVERVPQEAVIGLTYAIAAAAAILLADISPHGAEHLRDLLAGSIVWVTPHQVIKTGILYAIIGGFHYVFRKRFLLISLDPQEAYARGLRVRLWDFLFYLSFGVVITSSVQIAGVLLVFCYLVAPSVFAVMFADDLKTRLLLGWTVGTLVSAVGLFFSYDRPSGPMIMVCFAVVLVLGGGVRSISLAPNRGRTATLATASALLVAGAGYGVVFLGSDPGTQHQHGGESHHVREFAAEKAAEHELGTSLQDLQLGLRDSHAAVRAKAINELVSRNDRSAVPDIIDRLGDSSTAVRENAAKALGVLGDPAAIPALKRVMEVPGEDEWIRLQAAESVARLGDAAGLPLLLQLARHAEAGLARHEALEALVELSSLEMPEDAGASEKLDLLAAWLERNRTDLTWDPASGTFLPHAAAP